MRSRRSTPAGGSGFEGVVLIIGFTGLPVLLAQLLVVALNSWLPASAPALPKGVAFGLVVNVRKWEAAEVTRLSIYGFYF